MNKAKIKQEEIQPLLLKILTAFDSYCRNHSITYYLSGGTLLGAVRHQGFIPWDDDIDVCINKKDEEKLISLSLTNPYIDKEHRYKISVPFSENYFYPFIKIIDTKTIIYEKHMNKKYSLGLFLDVFTLTYWPESTKTSKLVVTKQTILKYVLYCLICEKQKNHIKWLITKMIRYLLNKTGKDYHYWSRKIYDLGNINRTNYIGNLIWTTGLNGRFKKEWFNSTVLLNFEGLKVLAPVGYKDVLKTFYGDYMKLPAPENRIRHEFDAYYISH